RAIASYERTQISFDSPFDHFMAGDAHAIDDSAKRGWELFNTRGRCNKCHASSEDARDVTYFTDNDFHNIGIGIIRHNVVALARQAEQLINSGDQTEGEIDDVVAFLASLTSADYAEHGRAELARQRALSQTDRPQRDTARAFGPKPPRPKPPAP